MKKVAFGIFFSCLIINSWLLFALEHSEANGYYKYYNSDGSLDWDTFYTKWDEIPGTYFMYLYYYKYNYQVKSMLWKVVGGLEATLDDIRSNDITFTREKGISKLEIIFSPWNYTKAKDIGWIPLGQKRYNYNDAIERWNFMLKNME